MKLSFAKIHQMIFDELGIQHWNAINIKKQDDWYGKNRAVLFNVDGIKGWLFAIFIWDDEEGDKKHNIVYFLGERENWIDKFKPGHCSIESSVELDANGKSGNYQYDVDFDPWMDLLADVYDDMSALKRNRHMGEYIIDSHGTQPYIKWLIDDIWYYNVRKPIENWWEKKVIPFIGKLAVKLWKKKGVTVKYRESEDTRSCFDVFIDYDDNLTDDEVSDIYFWFKKRLLYKFLEKNWNEPLHRYHHRIFYINEF